MSEGEVACIEEGTPQGTKPADNVPTIRVETERNAIPAIYADAKNLRLKRRHELQVKSTDTLAQKNGNGVGLICCLLR